MNGFYGLARMFSGFLGFTALLGVIWFATSLGTVEFVAGLILGLASLSAALVPQRTLSLERVRRTVILLCMVGISGGLALIASNLVTSRGIEWDVVVINLLNIGALSVMAIRAREVSL